MIDRNHVLILFNSDSLEVEGVEHPHHYICDPFPYETVEDLSVFHEKLVAMSKELPGQLSYLVIDTTERPFPNSNEVYKSLLGEFLGILIRDGAQISCMNLNDALPFALMAKTILAPYFSGVVAYKGKLYEIHFEDDHVSYSKEGKITKCYPVTWELQHGQGTPITISNSDFTVLVNPATIQYHLCYLKSSEDLLEKNRDDLLLQVRKLEGQLHMERMMVSPSVVPF